MSSYTKSTDFASKDSLLTGNPLKVVKGTEIDDEFNAIQTSINSKADTNSPALAGTPTAPTASTGINTTQIATTAFVQQEITANATDLSAAWPVGSVYINATDDTNPATLLGFGTWLAFGEGRVIVGVDADDEDETNNFSTAGSTGGAKTHQLTVDEMPSHRHTTPGSDNSAALQYGAPTDDFGEADGFSGYTGGDEPHNNLQPYIVVYMWKRTA